MPRTSTLAMIMPTCALMLVLAGCGDSTPLSSDTSAGSYTPSTGAFAAISAPSSRNIATVNTCNLDAVDDKPAGSGPLQHGSVATFAGWAADAGSGSVPVGVQVVLKGAHDYAVNAATGAPRPDVASASNRPGWATAGYSVKADLSAVAPGTYTPVLEFGIGGKSLRCTTPHPLTIQ